MEIKRINIERGKESKGITLNSTIGALKRHTGEISGIIHLCSADSLELRYEKSNIIHLFEKEGFSFISGRLLFPEKGPLMEEVYYNLLSVPFVRSNGGRFNKEGKIPLKHPGYISPHNLFLSKEALDNIPDKLRIRELPGFLLKSSKKEELKGIYDGSVISVTPIRQFPLYLDECNISGHSPSMVGVLTGLILAFITTIIGVDLTSYIVDAYLIYLIFASFVLSNWSFISFFHYLVLIPFSHLYYIFSIFKLKTSKGKNG